MLTLTIKRKWFNMILSGEKKDILKKYGFSWMSNVNLKEELSEQAAAEFENLIRTQAEHNRGPAPPKEGWKKQMYNQFNS